MKRKDLKVGEEYWYSRSNDWLERENAGQKIVVVDAGYWHLSTHTVWDRNREPRKDTTGNGVLVDLTIQGYGVDAKETIRRTVVNITQIRGLYEETRQQVKEFDAKRRARNEEKQVKNDRLTEQIKEAIERAADLDVKARRGSWQSDEVTLTVAEFTKLLDMAQGQER